MKLILTCLRGHRRIECEITSMSRPKLDVFAKMLSEIETRCERPMDVFETRRLDGICGAPVKAKVVDDGN